MLESLYYVYHREQTKLLKKEELNLVFECSQNLKQYQLSEFDYGVHNHYVFCINEDTQVIGVLIYFFTNEGFIWLSKIYVKPEYRRKKIASKMFNELLQFNKSIDLGVDPENLDSKQFFSSLGLKPVSLVFRKEL